MTGAFEGSSVGEDFRLAVVNTFLGGALGGGFQWLRGGSFRDGFSRGAPGGFLAFVGKRIAVEDFFGAGLLGRQVGALGSTLVRNAAEARPALADAVFPLGPVWLYIAPGDASRIRARLNLATTASLLYGILHSGLDLEWRSTFSAGAPVFTGRKNAFEIGGETVAALTFFGSILLPRHPPGEIHRSPVVSSDEWHALFGHERVHILQQDFAYVALIEPIERRLLARSSLGRAAGRVFHLGVEPFSLLLPVLADTERLPWEVEARKLAGR